MCSYEIGEFSVSNNCFVEGNDVAQKVIELSDAGPGQIILAVAFWGTGAAKALELDELASAKRDVTVLCDLFSQGCNPDEIKKIIDLGVKVKTLSGYHGKVYWTEHGCLIGSSNASNGGLHFRSPGNLEANAILTDKDTVNELKKWCLSLIEKADIVTHDLVEKAKITRDISGFSLEYLEENMRDKVKFALWSDPVTSARFNQAMSEGPDLAGGIDVYDGWDGFEVGDVVIDVNCKSNGEVELSYYIVTRTAPGTVFTYAKRFPIKFIQDKIWQELNSKGHRVLSEIHQTKPTALTFDQLREELQKLD